MAGNHHLLPAAAALALVIITSSSVLETVLGDGVCIEVVVGVAIAVVIAVVTTKPSVAPSIHSISWWLLATDLGVAILLTVAALYLAPY